MAIKRRVLLLFTVGISAVLLGLMNYSQGYKDIIVYMKDNQITLTKEAVFDRIFVNTNFEELDYMEGNQVFHFIGPFMYYILAIFWGSFYYLILKKNYHPFVYSRARTKRSAVKKIMGPFIKNIVLFVAVYVGTNFLLIYFNDHLIYDDVFSVFIKSLLFCISSIIISTGMTLFMFYLYLKCNEIIALLSTFMLILILFFTDLNWKLVSITFVGEDIYHLGGIVTGITLIVLSYCFLVNTKNEVG